MKKKLLLIKFFLIILCRIFLSLFMVPIIVIKLLKKMMKIIKFGHSNVFIYYGGLFEWLLLNELYGNEEFPLNKDHNSIDILLYRPSSTFTNLIN